MNAQQILNFLRTIEEQAAPLQLHKLEACARLNWLGDEISIHIEAAEEYSPKGQWRRDRFFEGSVADAGRLLHQALEWTQALPGPEQRAIEQTLAKLHQLAEELPSGGGNEALAAGYEHIRQLLLAEAKRVSEGALPAPQAGRSD